MRATANSKIVYHRGNDYDQADSYIQGEYVTRDEFNVAVNSLAIAISNKQDKLKLGYIDF